MNPIHSHQPDTPLFRHSPDFSLYCVLAVHAAWLLWIEQCAPAASWLSCLLVAVYVAWHLQQHVVASARDSEDEHPIAATRIAQ